MRLRRIIYPDILEGAVKTKYGFDSSKTPFCPHNNDVSIEAKCKQNIELIMKCEIFEWILKGNDEISSAETYSTLEFPINLVY